MAQQRNRRTNARIFLDTLEALGGGDVRINNQKLRAALGWDQDKYNSLKEKLASDGAIIAETGGPGGAVRLSAEDQEIDESEYEDGDETLPIRIFISYSHADSTAKAKLVKQLKPLDHEYNMEVWDDGLITAGDEWADEITEHIEEADIILLLVSDDFCNSAYCTSVEMNRALERHVDNEAVVIPILVRDCYWKAMPFKHLQGLPTGMQAIANWQNADAAFLDVVTKIREKLEELTQ